MLIDLSSVRMNVIDEGDGPVLLFIHGLGACHRNWEGQLDGFHGEFRCVAPDLRGAGQSSCPAEPYTLENMSDDLAELCARIGVTRACVIGQSMGGLVAQALAIRHPELVGSLVLVATVCPGRPGSELQPEIAAPIEAALERGDPSGIPGMVNDAIFPKAFQEVHPEKPWHFARELTSLDPAALLATMRRTWSTDFERELTQVEVPTLVVIGALDGAIPPEESRRLAELLPNAEVVVFQDCGHQLHFQDPDRFNELVRSFLAKHSIDGQHQRTGSVTGSRLPSAANRRTSQTH